MAEKMIVRPLYDRLSDAASTLSDAQNALRNAEASIKNLQRAIEAEGYLILVDIGEPWKFTLEKRKD